MNPRTRYHVYSLSRGAPSASWVLLQIRYVIKFGGESGIRTHGTLLYDGFQDRSVMTTSVSLHTSLTQMVF